MAPECGSGRGGGGYRNQRNNHADVTRNPLPRHNQPHRRYCSSEYEGDYKPTPGRRTRDEGNEASGKQGDRPKRSEPAQKSLAPQTVRSLVGLWASKHESILLLTGFAR